MSCMAFPKKVAYRVFTETNPAYQDDLWKRCHALYAGGRTLLDDKEVMKEVFPPHNKEDADVYKERCRRAYYIPYAGEIIDAIVASLTAQNVTLTSEPDVMGRSERPEPTGEIVGGKPYTQKPDKENFYREFVEDCSPPGGKRMSLAGLLREQVQTALVKRTAWTLVDLPVAPPDGYPSAEAEEAADARRAYACPIDPENVRDWEEDDAGELVWALIRHQSTRRGGLTESRGKVRETWTYYTTEGWARYVVEYEEGKEPKDDLEVKLDAEGVHSFGRVPLDRLTLPEGLWAMGKIESLAVAHLNKRNALSWAEFKSLFPVPVAYLSAPDPLNPATEDDARATNQRHGPGYMRVMAEKDKMEYFGPPTESFAMAKEDLDGLRDEMHRVLHHMALSVDNSGAALQRSAESKSIDQAAASVVLKALGHYAREHAIRVMQLAQAGRKDPAAEWSAHGMDSFDDVPLEVLVNIATLLEAIQLPSATFHQRQKMALIKKILGQDATDEDLEIIKDELEQNIPQDAFSTMMDPVAKAEAEAEIATKSAIEVEKAKPKPTAGASKKPAKKG